MNFYTKMPRRPGLAQRVCFHTGIKKEVLRFKSAVLKENKDICQTEEFNTRLLIHLQQKFPTPAISSAHLERWIVNNPWIKIPTGRPPDPKTKSYTYLLSDEIEGNEMSNPGVEDTGDSNSGTRCQSNIPSKNHTAPQARIAIQGVHDEQEMPTSNRQLKEERVQPNSAIDGDVDVNSGSDSSLQPNQQAPTPMEIMSPTARAPETLPPVENVPTKAPGGRLRVTPRTPIEYHPPVQTSTEHAPRENASSISSNENHEVRNNIGPGAGRSGEESRGDGNNRRNMYNVSHRHNGSNMLNPRSEEDPNTDDFLEVLGTRDISTKCMVSLLRIWGDYVQKLEPMSIEARQEIPFKQVLEFYTQETLKWGMLPTDIPHVDRLHSLGISLERFSLPASRKRARKNARNLDTFQNIVDLTSDDEW